MPKKYHIDIQPVLPRFHPIGKYTTVEFREDCAGSCRECVKKKCIYGIFDENYLHINRMEEPEYLYTCQSCFRCVQECTKGVFSRVINPEYRTLGDTYWRPEIIHRTWYQAHTGKVPVSGAGYRGPFTGEGFDAIWTDMSEIVRPTRDGIHGREYISTCIELSRRVTPLQFNKDMTIASELPKILEVPIPLLFEIPEDYLVNDSILISAAKAAQTLGTMMFIRLQDYTDKLFPYADNLIPVFTKENYKNHIDLIQKSRAVEILYDPDAGKIINELRDLNNEVIICIKIPLDGQAAARALEMTLCNADTLHFKADFHGNEISSKEPRFLKDMIREIHLTLVEKSVRQKINLIFGGGMALAEHMAKAVICGADGIAADHMLLLALECRLCNRCKDGLSCPVKIDEEFDSSWGSRRIINLVGAWHSQLIEVMGAMGIREVRRLRGEVGRSMWFEDLEKENFGPIFGERKVTGIG